MPRLVLHADGSTVMAKPSQLRAYGWGAVATLEGSQFELQGAASASVPAKAAPGLHEALAIMKAIEWGYSFLPEPRDWTLIVDDEVFGYAQTWLHLDNRCFARREQLLSFVAMTAEHFFGEDPVGTTEKTLEALSLARVLKIDGHRQEVYQERCDHLAKTAAWRHVGKQVETLPFDAWLSKGFTVFDQQSLSMRIQHAPFCAPSPIFSD